LNKERLSLIDETIDEVNLNLEDIAKFIVSKEIEQEKNNLIRQYKQQFFMQLDFPEQHKPNWHQWGIIKHSRNCLDMYNNEGKQYLKSWGKFDFIEKYLSKKIDGLAKSKLINLGILLHDMGKLKKQYRIELNMKVKYSFNNHEAYSQEIIQTDLYPLLHDYYGLTDMQIKYISMCASYHGLIRKICKTFKYSIEFAQTEDFKNIVLNELPSFEEYKIEVGILFLADSCAKTNVAFENKTDEEILKDLNLQNLNPKLINAVHQKAVSIEIAKSYFNIINGG
jgi:hypothetical protein